MTYRCFEVSTTGQVAHVRFARPGQYNTMVPDFWRELPEVVRAIDDAGQARAIVLSSSGKHFTAGMDLEVFSSLGADPDAGSARARSNLRAKVLELQDAFNVLERARLPVLAAIQGGCIGGGVDLVSACDMRYASADAFFCIQEINLGMTADVGTLQRLPHLIPQGLVRELAYTGRRLSAEQACRAGLVNEVYATHEEMRAAVMEIAAEIAARAPVAVHGTKVMLNYARDHPVPDALDFVATWQSGMLELADVREALAAKAEKRAPRFADLPPLRKGL